MKKQAILLLILIVSIPLFLNGCKQHDDTYTVWTTTDSYTDFKNVFGDLDDDYFTKITFSDEGWNLLSSSLNNTNKYQWDEEMIKTYFIGRAFIDSQAKELTSWLITTKHGMVSLRKGNKVYSIIK